MAPSQGANPREPSKRLVNYMRVSIFCEDGSDVWISGISGDQVELSIHRFEDGSESSSMCVVLNKRQCQELGIAAMTVLKTELFIEGTDTQGLF